MIEAIGLYLAVAAAHELLHYVSARKKVDCVVVSRKHLGLVGLKLRERPSARDILLPQLITLVLLVYYVFTSSPAVISVALAHVASSIGDFYLLFKVMGK